MPDEKLTDDDKAAMQRALKDSALTDSEIKRMAEGVDEFGETALPVDTGEDLVSAAASALEFVDGLDATEAKSDRAFESADSLSNQIKVYDLDNKYDEKEKKENKTNKDYESENRIFRPSLFLNPDRPKVKFITNLEELKPIITETFESLTGTQFPDDINIRICSSSELKKAHEKISGSWSNNIQGFSLNRNRKGINEIFVKEDCLDSMMVTIGHEIGHVMTPTLNDRVNEEAKAFAFSLAWMETIKENNIGGLAPNISINPAKNGLHDKAFNFVIELLNSGKTSFEIFSDIAKGEFSFNNCDEIKIECEVL